MTSTNITTTRSTDAPPGLVQYIVTDSDTGDTLLVSHNMGGVCIENNSGGVFLPIRLVNEVLKATAGATGVKIMQDV